MVAGEHEGRDTPAERLDAARETAARRAAEARQRATDARQRATDAGQAAAERVGEARDAAIERLGEAGEALADARERDEATSARVKPRLRGVSHQWAFFASLATGAALVSAASADVRLPLLVYAFSLSALLGTSAVYHRVTWQRPSARLWMRRLDHSMIFVLIAGTITPFAAIVIGDGFGEALLIAVWAAAAAGIVVELIWVEAPKWVSALVYVAVALVGAVGFPAIVSDAGVGAGALILIGGVIYGAGALVYARQRPDPNPAVFGYHEIFHVLVLAAAAVQFAAVAIYAAPGG